MQWRFVLENDPIIVISELPMSIQQQLPFSIRTKKEEYLLSSLPYPIQYLVNEYYKKTKEVTYDFVLDYNWASSAYGDFKPITTYYDLVIEYIKTYLLVQRGAYPFDPTFYSKLKEYIQVKDTSIQQTLVNNEIKRIINIVSVDLNIPITVSKFEIYNDDVLFSVSQSVSVVLTINKKNHKLIINP